jgi:diguanylate cyclase (GGDEF)-like protein
LEDQTPSSVAPPQRSGITSQWRRAGVAAVLTVLLIALGYFFVRTQSVDIEAQNRLMLNLRELEKLDAEWDVDILRSRLGLSANYDALAEPLPRMHNLQLRLKNALPSTRGPEARLVFDELTQALAAKEKLVEQFKVENARLRAALVDFAPAITDLKTELSGAEGAAVPARLVRSLDAGLNVLLSDVLRYNQAPEPRLKERIERTLLATGILKSAFSPAVGASIDQLTRHARTIAAARPLENALQARIEATRTGAAMDRLGVQFDKSFDQGMIEQQRYRGYLFVYAGLLLVLLAWAAWRLRRSYSIIGMVNQRLKAANETLELRVAERTAELEAQSARLEQLALHDSLTGLINYGQLTRLLEHALVRAGRRGTTVVVMFIDLDGFKAVNDTYGHATGDLVLKAVAERVTLSLRKEDALARLGGDEFVILLEEVGSHAGALRVAQLALDQIRGITDLDGCRIAISASIGVSSAHGKDGAARGAAVLLAEADQAMYRAKQAGKNGVVFSEQAEWAELAPPPVRA